MAVLRRARRSVMRADAHHDAGSDLPAPDVTVTGAYRLRAFDQETYGAPAYRAGRGAAARRAVGRLGTGGRPAGRDLAGPPAGPAAGTPRTGSAGRSTCRPTTRTRSRRLRRPGSGEPSRSPADLSSTLVSSNPPRGCPERASFDAPGPFMAQSCAEHVGPPRGRRLSDRAPVRSDPHGRAHGRWPGGKGDRHGRGRLRSLGRLSRVLGPPGQTTRRPVRHCRAGRPRLVAVSGSSARA